LGFQASYTYSKSLDDTSTVLGGTPANAGVILQALPQNPRDPCAEKGPSTFDITQAFSLSLIWAIPLDRVDFLQPLGSRVTQGWQVLNVTSVMTGPPFTVYSGIQQTGAGAGGTDRPDLVTMPDLSTSRTIREDYFGRGANNSSFFSIPINLPGGTGPNQGYFGTLGRDTFRGPGFQQYDIALIKNTTIGRGGAEWGCPAISRGVLQHFQYCEFRIAFEHLARHRLRYHQQNRRAFPPNPILPAPRLLEIIRKMGGSP
jgi:hypothetical protein